MHSESMEIKTSNSVHDINITTRELQELITNKTNITLLDVRTHQETEIASIGGVHIPLNELPNRINELDPESHIVIYCHHGVRSLTAVGILQSYGFNKVQHLRGGIDAWSDIIDPSIRKY
jgi:sulfur-carrier protein adenylyltransferase/sulfurtransferase